MFFHLKLSERYYDQIKAAEWIKEQCKSINQITDNKLAKEVEEELKAFQNVEKEV